MQWDGALTSGFARRSLTPQFYLGRCPCCQEACDWQMPRSSSDSNNNVALYDAAQASVRALFSKPYFGRLGPVQEICMVRLSTFYCGKHSITFEDLYHALEMLTTLQSQLQPIFKLYKLIQSRCPKPHNSESSRFPTCLDCYNALTAD